MCEYAFEKGKAAIWIWIYLLFSTSKKFMFASLFFIVFNWLFITFTGFIKITVEKIKFLNSIWTCLSFLYSWSREHLYPPTPFKFPMKLRELQKLLLQLVFFLKVLNSWINTSALINFVVDKLDKTISPLHGLRNEIRNGENQTTAPRATGKKCECNFSICPRKNKWLFHLFIILSRFPSLTL